MYAHVTTCRLGGSAEVGAEIEWAHDRDEPVSDQTARTIASWWHSPSDRCRNLTALSHGHAFHTKGLAEEVAREVTHPGDRDALTTWLYALEDLLSA